MSKGPERKARRDLFLITSTQIPEPLWPLAPSAYSNWQAGTETDWVSPRSEAGGGGPFPAPSVTCPGAFPLKGPYLRRARKDPEQAAARRRRPGLRPCDSLASYLLGVETDRQADRHFMRGRAGTAALPGTPPPPIKCHRI